MNEIVPIDETVRIGTLQATSPADVIDKASGVATVLAKVINDKKLYSVIRQKKYVYVEGWSTLGAMIGVLPRTVSANEIDDSGIFEAEVELIRITDQAIIGRGIAECGSDDEVDRDGKPVWSARPRYARRSMAITRATGKAYRLGFAWIMNLAGYEGTPAEEMQFIEGSYTESPKEKVEKVFTTPPKPSFADRPYDPPTLRAAIEAKAKDCKPATDKQLNLVLLLLNEYYLGDDDRRHEAQMYLLGASSLKDVDSPLVTAMLNWMEIEKDSGGKYMLSEMAMKELSGVTKAFLKEKGQQELL